MTSVGVGLYNMHPAQPYSSDQHAAATGAITGRDSNVASVNVENPFVWLVGIAFVTIGLIGFSTHVRVGNVRAGIDAGQT